MNTGSIARRLTGRIVAVLCSRVVGIPVAIVVLCLAGVLQFRQSRLAGVPDIGHPFDVEEWGYIEIDPAENAAGDYEAAARLYRGISEPSYEELDIVWERGWAEASPTVHTWLEDNRAALLAWRVGTTKDTHLRVQPAEITIDDTLSILFDCRYLSKLAQLEAERLRFLGDIAVAWEWLRASIRFTHHSGMNAGIINRISEETHYSLCVRRIVAWAQSSNVSSEQLAQALSDVRAAWNLSSSVSASFRAEYFYVCNELAHLEEVRSSFDRLANDWGMDDLRIAPKRQLWLNNEPELTRRLLQHQIANLLTFADEPLSGQPRQLPQHISYFDFSPPTESELLSPSEFQIATRKSLLGRNLLLRRNLTGFIHRERAHQGLLELVLAAEWHRRETGEFPASIDELLTVPMLDEIPPDALSRSGAPLRYERHQGNPQRAKVWSVGRNGVDDGGAVEQIDSTGFLDLGYWIGEPQSAPAAE